MPTALALPPHLFDLFNLDVHPVQTLDDSGEDCRYCQLEDRYVEVQAYGTLDNGQPLMVSACCDCLGNALLLAEVDMLGTIVVEFER
jgi:hypothetical protein